MKGEYENRARFNFKTRFRPASKLISLGLNGNIMFQHAGFFVFWNNDSTGAYLPLNASTNLSLRDLWITLDPFLILTDGSGSKHSIRTRYFATYQTGNDQWQPATHLFHGDYHFQRAFAMGVHLSAGSSLSHFLFTDEALGGTHSGNAAAAFVQADHRLNALTVAGGLRMEMFRIDQLVESTNPLGRFGVNYAFGEKLFLRASAGQGFRFPSPAERFVRYNVDIINIYPNPDLQPETGWNAELGARRIWLSETTDWVADAALYWTQYNNMMEFSFGQWGDVSVDPLAGLGFKSVNVNRARVAGIETSLGFRKQWRNNQIWFQGGYNYNYPVDLNVDTSLQSPVRYLHQFFKGFVNPDSNYLHALLKYRFRHMLKCEAEFSWQHVQVGFALRYYSFMEKIDAVFEVFIPGVASYRQQYNHGSAVLDAHFSMKLSGVLQASVHLNNLMNSFYVVRAARPEAPRNVTLRMLLQF
jgi:iron complex outermembrane receptor protein